jgi:FkbM family methyltransferase
VNYEFQPTCQIEHPIIDKLYTDAFGVKSDGCFVEIGAHDGWHWSFTWGLAKMGWTGLYVEPVETLYQECIKTHAAHYNTSVLRCCVGEREAMVMMGMQEYGGSLISTEDQFEIQQYTLDTVLTARAIPKRFDLLVIDVEYAEDRLLKGFHCADWMPKLIIIERPPANEFESLGYSKVHEDWINTVYSRGD